MSLTAIDEFQSLDEFGRPVLPPGLTWVEQLDGGIYTNEQVKSNVENFGQFVAEEISQELETSPKIRIVVPISGGFVAYNSVLKHLRSKGISASQLEIVFASNGNSSHSYSLSKNYSGEDIPTFLVDDIYDKGDSFIAIRELIPSKRFVARYLSTKEGCDLPEECIPENGMIEMDVMRAIWLANPYGMNSNIAGFDILERLSALPIGVEDMAQIKSWLPEHHQLYREILQDRISAFYTEYSEALMMIEIYQRIKEFKANGDYEGLYSYLDEKVSQILFAYYGFIS